MLSEIKENVQGTNSDRKETRTQINIHPEENEETRILKSEGTLTSLWDNLKPSNIRIMRVPEVEEQK